MKARLLIYIMVLALAAGCQKTDTNGPIDGMWQLTSLRLKSSDAELNDKADEIYWHFKLQLMKVEKIGHHPCLNTFRYTGDSLHVLRSYLRPDERLIGANVPTATTDENGAPTVVSDFSHPRLEQVGMAGDGKFRIEAAADDRLVLSRGDSILTFRKY